MKQLLIALAGLIAFVALFFAFNHFIYTEKQGDGAVVEPYRATLSGTMVCLPQKGPGPHTKECAPGIKTDVGEHYAIDFSLMSQTTPVIENGEYFTASGVITAIERLSTDHWQKYDIEGIFSITNGVVVGSASEPIDTSLPPAPGKCYVGGCSAQLCTDTPDMASTCEWREEYGCYQTATCERQATGQCGWTETAALRACVGA